MIYSFTAERCELFNHFKFSPRPLFSSMIILNSESNSISILKTIYFIRLISKSKNLKLCLIVLLPRIYKSRNIQIRWNIYQTSISKNTIYNAISFSLMATTPIPHRKGITNIPMTKHPGPDEGILMIVHANKLFIRNICL